VSEDSAPREEEIRAAFARFFGTFRAMNESMRDQIAGAIELPPELRATTESHGLVQYKGELFGTLISPSTAEALETIRHDALLLLAEHKAAGMAEILNRIAEVLGRVFVRVEPPHRPIGAQAVRRMPMPLIMPLFHIAYARRGEDRPNSVRLQASGQRAIVAAPSESGIDVSLFLFADAANVSTDRKLNVTGIFRFLIGESFPFAVPTMVLVLQFVTTPEMARVDHTLAVTITAPNADTPYLRAEWTLKGAEPPEFGIPDPKVETTIVQSINGLVVSEPGVYVARAILDGAEVKQTRLRVVTRGTYDGD
jgi:hypothetical protein